LGTLIKFIKDNPKKRYVIVLDKKADMNKAVEQTELVATIAEDYTIQCETLNQLFELRERRYNAFITHAITTWEEFHSFQELGVTDIYIDSPLTFQCEALRRGKENAKIRVSPTISPNGAISANRTITSFFIRPEDLSIYEGAIDIIDFKVLNQDQEDALFDIYTRGSFIYGINELIPGLQLNVNNVLFDGKFGETRSNCGQKCLIPGHSCHYCKTYALLMEKFVASTKLKETS
jgi:hypothetical protein